MSQLSDDPKWVSRMEKYFDFVDKDHNGVITVNELQRWATNMETLCKASPDEMVKLRAQLYTFWGKIGLKPNVLMTKKDFIIGASKLAKIDLKRSKNGQMTFLQKMNDAFFDVTDSDKDDVLRLAELKCLMIATGMNPQGASAWLKQVDTDNNGYIDRQKFFASEYKFWYGTKHKEIMRAIYSE